MILAVLAVGVTIGPAGPAAAAEDPYAADPLGLVANLGQLRVDGSRPDTWEVWVCDAPDGAVDVDPASITATLSSSQPDYFRWLSDGRYEPRFVVGGTVTTSAASGWPDEPFRRQSECEQRVRGSAGGSAAGALIVVDVAYGGGYASPGVPCWTGQDCPKTYPANGRVAVVGAAAVVSVAGAPAQPRTVAHELGHAIGWPHSFGGLIVTDSGRVDEYDNPNDLMSGGNADGLDVGTLVLNRYAAGWIGAEAVAFHRGGSSLVELVPSGRVGIQMLVLPSDAGPGVFTFVGARVRDPYELGIGREGVEIYTVDQRGTACGLSAADVCWGLDRRTRQQPASDVAWATDHVLGPGESATVGGVTLTVLERSGARFLLAVEGASVSERFVDDDGNPHEAAIEAIAAAGITNGCNPPVIDRYCPSLPVTRAQMAAFLLRALGEVPAEVTSRPFPDVPADAWYAPAVARIAELGIAEGYTDGTFRPDRAVTRAEMAALLVRALPALAPLDPTEAFVDVPADAWYAPAVEGLRAAGVTAGCSVEPARYCPNDPVLRDQMATFLDRAVLGG